MTIFVEFPELFHPDVIKKFIRVKIYNMKQDMCLGTVMCLGRSEEHAFVSTPQEGVIEVPRHHMSALRPVGSGNKVVVARGDLMGKVGTVKSKSQKFNGKWQVKEHLTDDLFLVDPNYLVTVENLPNVC